MNEIKSGQQEVKPQFLNQKKLEPKTQQEILCEKEENKRKRK